MGGLPKSSGIGKAKAHHGGTETRRRAKERKLGFSGLCVQGQQFQSVLSEVMEGTSNVPGQNIAYPDRTLSRGGSRRNDRKGLRSFESDLGRKIGQLSVLEFG